MKSISWFRLCIFSNRDRSISLGEVSEMIEIKVTANLNNGRRVLTATDKVNTIQEAKTSIRGFIESFKRR